MSEIIVLGLIPGTKIQITFLLWLIGLVGVGAYVVVRYERRSARLRSWLIVTTFMIAMRRPNRALF
jgi:hypothetical protein